MIVARIKAAAVGSGNVGADVLDTNSNYSRS